jgi:pilus assembly protein CpaE
MVVRASRRSARSNRDPADRTRRVAVVEADSDVLTHLAEPLSGFDTLAFSELDELTAAEAHLEGPLVVVLGPSQTEPNQVEKAGKLIASRSDLGAVLVMDVLSTDVLRLALRAGIDDAIAYTSAAVELGPVVREISARLAATSAAGESLISEAELIRGVGRITTVFSPKGGVGKSVIAVNLAASLAQNSARPVVLVDLDLQFGDVAVMMRMLPNSNIVDLAKAGRRVDSAFVRGLLTADEATKTLVMPAPPEPTVAGEVDSASVSILFAALREMGAHVIVDTPTGLNDFVLSVLSDSDDIVYVVGMDIPSVKNAKLGLQAFEVLEIPLERVLVALNRANTKVNLAVKDVERTLEMKVDVSLPSEAIVPQSVNKGVAAVLEHRKSRFAGAIEQLAQKIRARAVSAGG